MKLEIVSHCWHYWRQLNYQLSSLVLYPPMKTETTMTVYYSEEDTGTVAVLDFFRQIEVARVTWAFHPLPKRYLFRRSIGRNLSAIGTSADWVWFTDADMCFRSNCLDALAAIAPTIQDSLIYPRFILISPDHAAGDEMLAAADRPCLADFPPGSFVPHRFPCAVGAVQILRGSVARRLGYNRFSAKYQQPIACWQRCRDDVAFRKTLGSGGRPIELPELYRIRHEKFGPRDEQGVLKTRTA